MGGLELIFNPKGVQYLKNMEHIANLMIARKLLKTSTCLNIFLNVPSFSKSWYWVNVISSELDVQTFESFRKTCRTSNMLTKMAPPGTDQIELSFPLHPPDSPATWGQIYDDFDHVGLIANKNVRIPTPPTKKNNWTHHIMLSELKAIACQKMNKSLSKDE